MPRFFGLVNQFPEKRGGGHAGGDGKIPFPAVRLKKGEGVPELLPLEGEHPHAVFQLAVVTVKLPIRERALRFQVKFVRGVKDPLAVFRKHLVPVAVHHVDDRRGLFPGIGPQREQPLPVFGEPHRHAGNGF